MKPILDLREDKPLAFRGNFRQNIETFIEVYCEKVQLSSNLEELQSRRTDFFQFYVRISEASPLRVFLILELLPKNNQAPICDNCRVLGWENQPVTSSTVHIIIPKYSLAVPDSLPTYVNLLHPPPNVFGERPLLDVPTPKIANTIASKWHILHTVIHLNGVGHLLRINGWAGGSDNVTGNDIAILWGKLCTILRVVVVCTEDVSNKYGMDLRVLYPAMYGHTWYGRFGYEFARSGYGKTKLEWETAVNTVQQAQLSTIIDDFQQVGNQAIVQIVEKYTPINKDRHTIQRKPSTLQQLLQAIMLVVQQPSTVDQYVQLPPNQFVSLDGSICAGSNNTNKKHDRQVDIQEKVQLDKQPGIGYAHDSQDQKGCDIISTHIPIQMLKHKIKVEQPVHQQTNNQDQGVINSFGQQLEYLTTALEVSGTTPRADPNTNGNGQYNVEEGKTGRVQNNAGKRFKGAQGSSTALQWPDLLTVVELTPKQLDVAYGVLDVLKKAKYAWCTSETIKQQFSPSVLLDDLNTVLTKLEGKQVLRYCIESALANSRSQSMKYRLALVKGKAGNDAGQTISGSCPLVPLSNGVGQDNDGIKEIDHDKVAAAANMQTAAQPEGQLDDWLKESEDANLLSGRAASRGIAPSVGIGTRASASSQCHNPQQKGVDVKECLPEKNTRNREKRNVQKHQSDNQNYAQNINNVHEHNSTSLIDSSKFQRSSLAHTRQRRQSSRLAQVTSTSDTQQGGTQQGGTQQGGTQQGGTQPGDTQQDGTDCHQCSQPNSIDKHANLTPATSDVRNQKQTAGGASDCKSKGQAGSRVRQKRSAYVAEVYNQVDVINFDNSQAVVVPQNKRARGQYSSLQMCNQSADGHVCGVAEQGQDGIQSSGQCATDVPPNTTQTTQHTPQLSQGQTCEIGAGPEGLEWIRRPHRHRSPRKPRATSIRDGKGSKDNKSASILGEGIRQSSRIKQKGSHGAASEVPSPTTSFGNALKQDVLLTSRQKGKLKNLADQGGTPQSPCTKRCGISCDLQYDDDGVQCYSDRLVKDTSKDDQEVYNDGTSINIDNTVPRARCRSARKFASKNIWMSQPGSASVCVSGDNLIPDQRAGTRARSLRDRALCEYNRASNVATPWEQKSETKALRKSKRNVVSSSRQGSSKDGGKSPRAEHVDGDTKTNLTNSINQAEDRDVIVKDQQRPQQVQCFQHVKVNQQHPSDRATRKESNHQYQGDDDVVDCQKANVINQKVNYLVKGAAESTCVSPKSHGRHTSSPMLGNCVAQLQRHQNKPDDFLRERVLDNNYCDELENGEVSAHSSGGKRNNKRKELLDKKTATSAKNVKIKDRRATEVQEDSVLRKLELHYPVKQSDNDNNKCQDAQWLRDLECLHWQLKGRSTTRRVPHTQSVHVVDFLRRAFAPYPVPRVPVVLWQSPSTYRVDNSVGGEKIVLDMQSLKATQNQYNHLCSMDSNNTKQFKQWKAVNWKTYNGGVPFKVKVGANIKAQAIADLRHIYFSVLSSYPPCITSLTRSPTSRNTNGLKAILPTACDILAHTKFFVKSYLDSIPSASEQSIERNANTSEPQLKNKGRQRRNAQSQLQRTDINDEQYTVWLKVHVDLSRCCNDEPSDSAAASITPISSTQPSPKLPKDSNGATIRPRYSPPPPIPLHNQTSDDVEIVLVPKQLKKGIQERVCVFNECVSWYVDDINSPWCMVRIPNTDSPKQIVDTIQAELRKVFVIMQNMEITRIEGIQICISAGNTSVAWGPDTNKCYKKVVVLGSKIRGGPLFRRVGGYDDWVVKCICGTSSDDGFRFIACDTCNYWFHTRCVGIHDADVAPENFLCHNCTLNTYANN